MSIERLTLDGYGIVETNRVDRDNVESQCILDTTDFPNGVENGTIVAVIKAEGKLKKTGVLKGMVINSERLYNQYQKGLKNYKVEAGNPASVYFFRKGDTVTTNTICYDTSDFDSEETLISALKAAGTTPVYAEPHTDGIIKIVKANTSAPFTVVKYTKLPDNQQAVKLIVSDISKL